MFLVLKVIVVLERDVFYTSSDYDVFDEVMKEKLYKNLKDATK